MGRPLRVLMVEDSEDDAVLLTRELRRGGFTPLIERVDTRDAMKQALRGRDWDIVISDYVMPHFSAPDALSVLKESGRDLPFIVVSGAVGEDTAVNAMRTGAHDYLMKDRLARLIPAIDRELVEAANRRERRRVEELSARLGRILDNSSNEIYVFDAATLRFLQVNKGARQNLGYTEAELAALTPLDLQPELTREDLDTILTPLRQRERDQVVMETVQRRKDGSTYPVEARLHLSHSETPPVFVAIIQDIAERKQAEAERERLLAREKAARAEAEAAQRRLAFLAEASAVLGSSLDYETTLARLAQSAVPYLADWCIVDMLEKAGELRTMAITHVDPRQQTLVQELRRLYPPSAADAHPIWRVLQSGRSQLAADVRDEDIAARARDERHLQLLRDLQICSHMVVPLLSRGRTLGAISFVRTRDCTPSNGATPERNYSQADLDLAEELAYRAAMAVDNAQLYEEARAAIRERDQFISVASHELKTPLTALQGYAQLLHRRAVREGILNARDLRALQTIYDQATRLHKLIEQLLDLSRLQSGQLSIQRRPFDLVQLAKRLADEVQPTLAMHTLELLGVEDPLIIEGDELRLEQVLQNLIGNAVKYSPEGGPITVRIERREGEGLISVSDQGMGIPAEHLDRIFRRFYRVNNDGNQGISGAGLGLFVVKEIVTLHGGTVHVDSEIGRGSTFTISLPTAGDSPPLS